MVDSYFKTELESKVRNKILKKYPKRKSDEKIDEELENDESEKYYQEEQQVLVLNIKET